MNSSAITQFDLAGDITASRYLRISRGTLAKLRKAGKLPYYRIGRRFFYISQELLESFHSPKS